MNDIPNANRTQRVHLIGASVTLTCVVLAVWLSFCAEQVWTRIIPVAEAVPVEESYTVEQVRSWVNAYRNLPTHQAKIRKMRLRENQLQRELDQWLHSCDDTAMQGVLADIESIATSFDVNVLDAYVEPDVGTADVGEVGWIPIHLEIEGDYQNVCYWLDKINEQVPMRCERFETKAKSPRQWQFEFVLPARIQTHEKGTDA